MIDRCFGLLRVRLGGLSVLRAMGVAVLAGLAVARAAELDDAKASYLDGDYAAVIKTASSMLHETPLNPEWPILLVRSLLATGRHAEADRYIRQALGRDDQSIRLRWVAREVALANGRADEAQQRVEEIKNFFRARPWNYKGAADLVALGQALLVLGEDPKRVLDLAYQPAQKAEPKLRDVYLARGELALEKHDFALAARAYEEGLKQLPDDPDLHSGRARAYANGDREVAITAMRAALKRNAKHVPTLLQFVDHHIDAESYKEAEETIEKIISVNPVQPDAWAYRAVIAHLRNDTPGEATARSKGLASWPRNPRVDYLIGKKLSQKYRFAEGSTYQRRALNFDPGYVPAMSQLASDLLRLGDETEGWKLAANVHERDEYDVEAYNLVTLRDTMSKYAELRSEDFVVRMTSREVAIYGPRVLALLRRAKESLVEKYGVELAKPTYVEIFAEQKDFAVRTFGLPDVPGFLGVCFGRVVTANSPASSTNSTNWESVLWHEFCHVVTLQLTKNKMPRWLSEGISVYEEHNANPSWGMRLTPRYRQMIMDGELTPVGKLSSAFLAPKTPQHLQFAYLESSMVVDFIIARFGLPALRGVLRDLGAGISINAALEKNTVPLEKLEPEFEKFAKERAELLAPKMNWEKPDADLLTADAAGEFAEWEKKHPDNYYALRLRAQRAVEAEKWTDARTALERLVELYPRQKGGESPYRMLVSTLRALGDTKAEHATLRQWAEVDDEAPEAYTRLMEVAAAEKDWATVARNAERYLCVNPLVAPPYRYQAQAMTALGETSQAIAAWQTLLQLDIPDTADANFRLSELLHQRGDNTAARKHVLAALEETPRYREALRLLVDIKNGAAAKPAAETEQRATPATLPSEPPPEPAPRVP